MFEVERQLPPHSEGGSAGKRTARVGRPPGRRLGLSLIELVLVLAVLVAVAALALPALRGPLANRRLTKSAELVRAAWAKARVEAMQSGRTYVFRHTPGSNAYQVRPWTRPEDILTSDRIDGDPDSQRVETYDDRPAKGRTLIGLPDDVFFLEGEIVEDARGETLLVDLPASSLGDDGQSAPIFFYPDGTTSDAQVALGNERKWVVTVRIRGLTGVAHIGPLQTRQELSRER